MKLWLLVLALLFTLGVNAPARAATALNFSGSVAELAWEKGPQSPEESVLRLTWKNAGGQTTEAPGAFKVVLFMPSMGHGSAPTFVEPARDASGAYRVSRLYFTMPGAWEVRVVLKSVSGTEETRALSLEIAEPAPIQAPAASPGLAASPALAAICADGVTPHPKWKGYWHLDRPHFAWSEEALYATMHLRPNDQGAYAVVKVDRANPEAYAELVRFKDPVRDLSVHDGKVWALFADRLVAVDAATGAPALEVKTSRDLVTAEEESAQSFTWAGSRLVIAHGTRGMVAYDEAAAGITMAHGLALNDNGRISKATDVTTVNEKQVVFAVENVSVSNQAPFPFEGLVLMNLNGGAAVERYPYDRKTSGSIAEARLSVQNGQVLINNWGILHQVSLAEMRRQGSVTVHWTPVHFDTNGGRQPGELLGDFIADGETLLACAQTQYQDETTRDIIHQGVVYQKNLAELLQRR